MASQTACILICKFNFPQLIRNCGWSESYALGYADLPTAIGSIGNIRALLVDRCNCLGSGPVMVSARLYGYKQPVTPGAPLPRRGSILVPVPAFPAGGWPYNKAFMQDLLAGNEDRWAADYGVSVLYMDGQTNLSGTPVYRRNLWIAGLPDIADLSSQYKLTDPATQEAVTKWIKDITGEGTNNAAKNNVSIQSTDASTGNAVKACTNWLQGPPISFIVPAHGFSSGQPLKAIGCTTQPGMTAPRGRYLVGAIIDANTFTLQGVTSVGIAVKPGGFRPDVKTFNTLSVVTLVGMTKRDKGRPSGLSVGRRRKPRTARA